MDETRLETQDSSSYAALAQTHAWGEGLGGPLVSADFARAGAARYEEAAVLGVGGMGKVVLAKDARIGRDVAVKVMRADRDQPEVRERFLREAQVQSQLEHPAIVPVYDIERNPDGSTFFTMRRVLGRSLAELVRDTKAGKITHTRRELLQAFATVCLAVDYAHSRGVIHRDLKPDNIMLGNFGEVYVLDWGIARVLAPHQPVERVTPRLSRPGTTMGTPLYMAPEQFADPDVNAAADVYSLGAILFELLTFERLRDPGALYRPVDARISARFPEQDVPPELEAICVRATQLEPTERFPSARAVHDAVSKYLDGDRELEQRRQAAASHATRARQALEGVAREDATYEVKRGEAMRELVRALALDPTNRQHVVTLTQILATPPASVPAEVKAQLADQAQDVMRRAARYSAQAMVSWLAFVPLVLVVGVRRVDYLALMIAATLATIGVAWASSRVRAVEPYVLLGLITVAGVAVTRLVGPLILVPTIFACWATVSQTYPAHGVRRAALIVLPAAPIVTIALELLGVLPASYAFDGRSLQVIPQLVDLSPGFVIGMLVIANALLAVLPAVFIGLLREQLTRAQTHQLVQTWHFRRLGDDLVRASG
jgi:eukaryotic-like serine/threonine-protein kinase